MSQPLLTVRGITQEFAQVKALDDVSLEIQPKQTYGLVGESGSRSLETNCWDYSVRRRRIRHEAGNGTEKSHPNGLSEPTIIA